MKHNGKIAAFLLLSALGLALAGWGQSSGPVPPIHCSDCDCGVANCSNCTIAGKAGHLCPKYKAMCHKMH